MVCLGEKKVTDSKLGGIGGREYLLDMVDKLLVVVINYIV